MTHIRLPRHLFNEVARNERLFYIFVFVAGISTRKEYSESILTFQPPSLIFRIKWEEQHRFAKGEFRFIRKGAMRNPNRRVPKLTWGRVRVSHMF